MTRRNAEYIKVVTCTACGHEFEDNAGSAEFDEHLRAVHPERWAYVKGEVARKLDALYPQGWEWPEGSGFDE